MRSSIEGLIEHKVRGTGNTTRVVDNAIQILFEDGKVIVEDFDKHKAATLSLIDRITKRIYNEHSWVSNYLFIDKENNILGINDYTNKNKPYKEIIKNN